MLVYNKFQVDESCCLKYLYAGMTYMISISNNEKKSGKESAAYTYIYIKVALRAEDVCIT